MGERTTVNLATLRPTGCPYGRKIFRKQDRIGEERSEERMGVRTSGRCLVLFCVVRSRVKGRQRWRKSI